MKLLPAFAKSSLGLTARSEVAKYENHSKQRATGMTNGRGAVIDRSFETILSKQERMIRQSRDNAGTKNPVDRVLHLLTRLFIDDPKHDRKGHSFCLGLRPACEP